MSTIKKRELGPNNFVLEFEMTTSAAATSTMADMSSRPYRADGYLHKVATIPGTKAPTNNYDPVLKDMHGVDLVGTPLTNRSATVAQQAFPLIGTDAFAETFAEGELVVSVTGNAVTNATFKLLAFIRTS